MTVCYVCVSVCLCVCKCACACALTKLKYTSAFKKQSFKVVDKSFQRCFCSCTVVLTHVYSLVYSAINNLFMIALLEH